MPLFVWSFVRIQASTKQNKTGKGRRRLRSPSPTSSPHRNSKGDKKGSDDGNAKRHHNLPAQVRQGKRTDYLASISRRESVEREIHVIAGIFSNVQSSKLQHDASSETSVHTNTQLNLLAKQEKNRNCCNLYPGK